MIRIIVGVLMTIACVVCLTSCFGMNTAITLNQNGSGTIDLEYTVSQMLVRFGNVSESSNNLPLPVERDDFQRYVDQIEGMTLTNYRERENEDSRIINVTLEFASTDALADFLTADERSSLELTIDGQGRFYYTLITSAEEEVDASTVDLVKALFSDYNVSFSLTVPGEISQARPGTVEENGKTALFSVPIETIVASERDVVWEVSW